jgi:hypothetical protein
MAGKGRSHSAGLPGGAHGRAEAHTDRQHIEAQVQAVVGTQRDGQHNFERPSREQERSGPVCWPEQRPAAPPPEDSRPARPADGREHNAFLQRNSYLPQFPHPAWVFPALVEQNFGCLEAFPASCFPPCRFTQIEFTNAALTP